MSTLGIDLGTTYCSLSIWDQGKLKVIPDRDGDVLIPNYIAFVSGKYLAGNEARNKASSNPKNTVYDMLRFLGQSTDDSRIRNLMKEVLFKMVKSNDKPFAQVECDGELQTFSPEELLCLMLRELKEYAEIYLEKPVESAVISTAVDLNRWQVYLIKEAAFAAGLNVLKVTSSQKAAGIVHVCKTIKQTTSRRILIIDVGSSNTVASLFQMDNLKLKTINVSHALIGGEDFDKRILNYLVEEFKQMHGKDLKMNPASITRLRAVAETAKITLSTQNTAVITLDSIVDKIDYSTSVSRRQFEDLCCDLFWDILKPIEEVLSEVNFDKNSPNEILMIGGSSQIPKLREVFQDYFPKKSLDFSLNPLDSPASGCAILGAFLSNPTEVPELILQDTIPYCIGIETAGGVMNKMIEKNSMLPVSSSKTFTTFNDDEDMITILIYEGGSTMTRYNVLLGSLTITGLPRYPRGVPKIEITCSVDENFVLTVNARERDSGHFGETVIRDVKVTRVGESAVEGTQLVACR